MKWINFFCSFFFTELYSNELWQENHRPHRGQPACFFCHLGHCRLVFIYLRTKVASIPIGQNFLCVRMLVRYYLTPHHQISYDAYLAFFRIKFWCLNLTHRKFRPMVVIESVSKKKIFTSLGCNVANFLLLQ